MISVKGPAIKIIAAVIAVIALGVGIYMTFFQSAGYAKAEATITSIDVDPDYVPDPNTENDVRYIATAKYTIDGKEYTRALDSYSPSYKVGGKVDIMYDPKDPTKITSGSGFGIYLMIAGGIILIIVIFVTVKKKTNVKKLKESGGEIKFAPSQQGDERKLYFLTDIGTPKYGHRIEDKDRNVLFEAKMTKFSPLSDFEFDFIDRERGVTTHHYVGHTEESQWNSFLIDNNYTFSLDGKDVWKRIRENGVTIQSRLSTVNGSPAPIYAILRNGAEIAYVESTSQYVHEEDAEEHKIANKAIIQGFFRVRTREVNLDLLFVVLLAIARSGATDETGGGRRMVFNTLKGR